MLSFKKWLEATGGARIHPDPLIEPGLRIKMTGTGRGGMPHYDGVEIVRKRKCPDKLFGMKKIEKSKK